MATLESKGERLQVWPSAVANLILPAIVGSVDLFWIAQSGGLAGTLVGWDAA